jgi:hypothetical protein
MSEPFRELVRRARSIRRFRHVPKRSLDEITVAAYGP